MRKIEFRGKTVVGGRWVTGYYLHDGQRGRHVITDGLLDIDAVDPDTVGQFTSLYDKKGKPIFEGDILRMNEGKEILEVRFVRGVFAFLWNGSLDDECPTCAPTQEWAEIIGNIHDNPELMKGGRK